MPPLQELVYATAVAESTCEGADCQGCDGCPSESIGRNADEINAEMDAWRDSQIREFMTPEQIEARDSNDAPVAIPIAGGKTSTGLANCLFWLGVEIRYNTRAHSVEWRELAGEWAQLSDRKSISLREDIAAAFVGGDDKPLTFGRDAWSDAISALCYRTEVDPFAAWLESLPKWDGQYRLEFTLEHCFSLHDEDFELAYWASKTTPLAAIWRTYHPGTKVDEIPVYIGDGGIGKSTFLRELLPLDMPNLFSDSLNLAAQNKERVESTLGKVIVEISEMAGSTRADQESLKAYISRTDDGSVRLAFRRNPEPLHRMFVLAGTADRSEPLPNDRNLRRFVPIRLTGGNVGKTKEWLDDNREQIWAEALRAYRLGDHPRLPDDLKGQQAKSTSAARSKDSPMEDAVAAFTQDRIQEFTIAEIAYAIGLIQNSDEGARLQPRDSHRLGAALTTLGYTKKNRRRGGKQVTVWVSGLALDLATDVHSASPC